MKCTKEFLFAQGESPHDRGMSASLALHKDRPGFPRQASDIAWSLCMCLCFCVHVFVFMSMSLSFCNKFLAILDRQLANYFFLFMFCVCVF